MFCMPKRLLPSDETITALFTEQQLSPKQIANQYGVQIAAVHKRLWKLKLVIPNQKYNRYAHHVTFSDADLTRMYVTEKMSTTDIAFLCGVAKESIANHLKRLGITRPFSGPESRFKLRKRFIGQYHKGYPLKVLPNHPRASQGKVAVHILVMEEYLGKPLEKNQIVHHIDLDRGNFDITNLYVCESTSEHSKVHWQIQFLIRELFSMGLVAFDKNKGQYYLPQKKLH